MIDWPPLPLLAVLLGLVVGSFLNVVIERLPRQESIWWSRSHCPHCNQTLRWWELLPVASFVFLRGRCFRCRRGIDWQYPAVELATAAGFLASALLTPSLGAAAVSAAIVSVSIVVFVIDLRHSLILDAVTLPAMLLVFVGNLALGLPARDLVFGGILGGAFFLIQHTLSRGRWVGGGDIRMGLFMGLALGLPRLLLALVLAYVVGAIVAVALILARRKAFGSQLPFGTFLALATVIALFWGDSLIAWYQRDGLITLFGLNPLLDAWVQRFAPPI